MALPKSYLTSAKNLSGILSAIRSAQAPDKFTIAFLESLDFKSSSDRLIIGVLKSMGFIDNESKPTDRYFRFLDQTQSGSVLAEGIRSAYSDLFQVNTSAHKLSRSELINKFKTLSQGQLSESVLDKLALTFTELVKLADFSTVVEPKIKGGAQEVGADYSDDEDIAGRRPVGHTGNVKLGGLHYNIQIILPTTRDTKIYDAIFRSLREHLT